MEGKRRRKKRGEINTFPSFSTSTIDAGLESDTEKVLCNIEMEFIRGIATQISFQLEVLSSVSRTEPELCSNKGGLYKRLNCFLKSIVCWPRTKEGVSYNARLIFQSKILYANHSVRKPGKHFNPKKYFSQEFTPT